ncbi:FkbM family methyltransferase [Flavobacterium cellulosilyticum]|uniref:FkbM family methyltransferase n=1 Tax=Flavobacterium cellulosilyticum TaxID=2541731 RepID=A0A4R5CLR2_9FLAO|nr:FkbM family methyltransferase [Flavobacterium cellulosilyticum]TDD98404.1 FkbM family methyltransferase [Flavobacterium cellulosilyticum]
MIKILKKIFKGFGYKISKISKILLVDDNPFVAIKNKLPAENVVFFDIGANLGQTTKKMSNYYSKASIYAFEPSKKCFESLKINCDITNVSFHNLAMGSNSGYYVFNEYSWSAMNSFLERAYGTAKIIETYLVEVITIDQFCQNNSISYLNLLKTDTEGYELNVLKGASEMMKKNMIQFVYVEIFFNENYINQSSFGDIYNYLLENSFELVRFYDVNYTDEGLASKTDALFINKKFKLN